jgi:hypothetical protein
MVDGLMQDRFPLKVETIQRCSLLKELINDGWPAVATGGAKNRLAQQDGWPNTMLIVDTKTIMSRAVTPTKTTAGCRLGWLALALRKRFVHGLRHCLKRRFSALVAPFGQ